MFDKIEAIKDPKQDIKFWLDALSNENVDRKSKVLLNQCLQAELHNYLYPIYKIKTEPMKISPKEVSYKGKKYKIIDIIAVSDDEGNRYKLEGLDYLVKFKDLDKFESDYYSGSVWPMLFK